VASLQETTEAQKRAVLAEGARSGDAGVAAYQQAQAAIQAQRADATAEAARAAALIGATGSNTAANALITRPGQQLQDVLAGDQARFTNARGLEQQGSLDYLTIAAARGGGGGGGGGGSEKEKKEPELSDSELRVRLKGAATDQRQATVTKESEQLAGAKKQTRQTRAQLKAVNKQVRHAVKRAGDDPNNRQQKKIADLRAQRRDLRQGLTTKRATAREEYAQTARAIRTPLAPIATDLGVRAGVSPELAQGLFGPTESQSLNTADAKALKEAGGVEGLLGRVPRLTRRGASEAVKVAPAKVRQVRRSPLYRQLATTMSSELAAGKDFNELAKQLRNPPLNKKGKPVKTYPDSVINLVLLDYAPAFAR
jgi:hypothetical protein